MSNAYSLDLRKRVLKFLKSNDDKKAASKLFDVDRATVYRWIKQEKERGTLKPLQRKYAYRKIDYVELKKYIEAYPDQFLSEIAENFSVTLQAIFYALKKLKITRKKRPPSIKSGMKVKEKASLRS